MSVRRAWHGGCGTGGKRLYLAYAQAPYFPFMSLAVRARGDLGAVTEGIRQAVRALDPAIPVSRIQVMDELVRASVARPRLTAHLMIVFAGMAGLLSAVGLYGVLSYAVARRVREFGVRMALGARAGDLLALVTRRGLVLTGTGVALGTLAALWGAGFLRALLFGVTARDPLSFVGAGLLLILVATAASLVPAWRATRVAPVEALRSE